MSVNAALDRESLRLRLAAENIDLRAVELDGGFADEALVLERRAIGWAVYYAERGLRSDERLFATEQDACAFVLDRVLRDPSVRRR